MRLAAVQLRPLLGEEDRPHEAGANADFLRRDAAILVVGCGALGCEVLAGCLRLGLGERQPITVLDEDTVALSNLSRQALFADDDVGQPKSLAAARRLAARHAVLPIVGRAEEMPLAFYRPFHLVICAVDSLASRRWLNGALIEAARHASPIPLIEGGIEGLLGHVRIVLPGTTPCIECNLSLYPDDEPAALPHSLPLCALHGERIPQSALDCISWALSTTASDREPIADEPFARLIYEAASERRAMAARLGRLIPPFTLEEVQAALHRVIPAVATTVGAIAGMAATCNRHVQSPCAIAMRNRQTQSSDLYFIPSGPNAQNVACDM